MFTTDDITRFTAKIDKVLAKRYRSRNPPETSHGDDTLSIITKLSKGKFPIYLTSSQVDNQYYAMKVFPHTVERSYDYYKNEIRFAPLKHPNIINMVSYEDQRNTIQNGELKKVSYILMEYAPYGNFFDFIINSKDQLDEKLARTYFRELINGIEYLHSNNVAHLDLKPENLLLGVDFNLKITDFDLSHIFGDPKILSRGTRYYRAPEFFIESSSSYNSVALYNPFAADIYSAGIILFILKSGMYPHSENCVLKGVNFVELMYKDNTEFWAKHCEIQSKEVSFYSPSFKELFNKMVAFNPDERLTIKQIKESEWYNGPIYSPLELKNKMKEILNH